MTNQFDRTIKLIGESNFSKIQNSKIFIAGLGGVGGSVLECLVRSGFENITICDFDNFDETNLNRQILSNLDNFCEKKVIEATKRALLINKNVKVQTIATKISKSAIDTLPLENYDYVIDCIDNVEGKICLFEKCLKFNKIIVSCCGTAKRLDPTKIIITKLSKTVNDRLAKKLRDECKKNGIDSSKINVVISTETPVVTNSTELPSMMMVPTAAAMAICYFVIKTIINREI